VEDGVAKIAHGAAMVDQRLADVDELGGALTEDVDREQALRVPMKQNLEQAVTPLDLRRLSVRLQGPDTVWVWFSSWCPLLG
jgi:hypothetical protein